LAIDVRIRRLQRTVGYSPEWTAARALALLNSTLVPMAQLNQPWWETLEGAAASGARSQDHVPMMREVLSDYVEKIQGQYTNASTRNAYLSPLMKHVGPFFAYDGQRPRSVDEITGSLVSQFTALKQQERAVLRDVPDTLDELDADVLADPERLRAQLDGPEWELLCGYGQRGGRWPASDPSATGRFSISSRGLSNNEINRCLYRLRDVLTLAEEDYGLELRDPIKRRLMPPDDHNDNWLRPDHLQAIFDAAAELDGGTVSRVADHTSLRNGQARQIHSHDRASPYADLGRYEAIAVLALAGPRVSELCHARWSDLRVDGLWIPKAKTHAGTRTIHLHALVRGALEARRARIDPAPSAPIFATARGGHRDRNSVRNRVLAPVLERAAHLLADRGQDPLPGRVTPHTFRRTYLTYLGWADKRGEGNERSIAFARQQAGHKHAKITLEIYQQTFPGRLDPRVRAWLADDSDD